VENMSGTHEGIAGGYGQSSSPSSRSDTVEVMNPGLNAFFSSYFLAHTRIETPVGDFQPSEEADAMEQSRDSEGLGKHSIILLALLTLP